MASSDDDETAVHGAATAADTASTDGASPADALATASAAATAPSADHPTSTAIGMFFGMDGVVGGDAEDAINIIEDGDHVSAEDFGLSSTEISMNAMATASESMAAHMNLNMELNALQIQAFLARAENEPSSSNNSSAALLPVAGATDATAQATPAPVQESRQDDHAPAEPSHAAASPAPPPPPPTEDSRPQNAYEASRGVVFYSRREDKIKQIREHPIVASVSQDGRQIACKCGRNVRLNPPWYILKFEQHIVSRNCTFLRKKTKKSSNTTEPSTSIDSERMDQQGTTMQDARINDMPAVVAASAPSSPGATTNEDEGVLVENFGERPEHDGLSLMQQHDGPSHHHTNANTQPEAAVSSSGSRELAGSASGPSMLGEYALQSLHEILATSFGVNGDRSIVPPDQASAPEETIKQYETAMALQTHPHFSRITPDGRFVECKCASLIVLSGPWDLAKFEEHLVEKQKKKENRAAKRLEADGVPNKQQRKATRTLTKSAAAVRLKKKSFPREIHWDVATARNVFPCPGLRDDKMMAFVDAAVHLTGGARPRHKIAYELFPALFDADKAPSNSKKIAARLSEEEKLLLHDAIEAETLWFIDKDGGSVRSFDCKGVIEVGKGETVCAHCAELRSNVSLRTAVTSKVMKKKQQQPANPLHRKFCSSRVFSVLESEFNMQDEYARVLRDLSLVELADDSALNMWLDMAELGIHGAFDSHATLLGLVESMATLKDKERRGVGMQNMNYNHHLDAFMRSMAEISVDACDFFQHHLCGRKQKILLGRKRSKTLAHQQQQPHNNSSDPDEVLQPSTEELQMLQQHQQLLYEDAASSLHQTDGFAHLLDASNSSMMPNLSMSDIQDVDLSAFTTTATATSSTSVSTHAELSHSMAAEVDGHNSSALEQHGAVDNTGVMTSESPHGTNDHEDEEMEEDEGNDGNSDRFLSQLASSNGSSTRDQSADATTTATPAPQAPPRIPLDHMPCTGLRSEKVENYVKTAVQIIGGSRPKYVIAKELFPQVFQDAKTVKIGEKLNDQQKRVLQDAVFSECLWRVDKVGNCVRSLRCARIAETRAKGVCKPCWDLKTVANFRSVLSRAKVPKNLENVKFMPSMYTESDPFLRKLSKNASFRALYQLVKQRGPEDPKKVTFWLRCARMGVFGNFRTHPVFEGLMESMVEIKDKERRGVGKQNMQYSKPLDDFMNALSAISMEAFEVFASHFCGRTIRSQKVKKRKLSSTIASSLYEAHSDALHATATSSAEGVMVNGLHGAMDDGMHLHQHQHTELLNNNIMDIEQHANQHQQLAEDLLGSRPMSASDLEENQRFMDRMLDEVRLSHDMQLHDDHHHRSSLDNSTALDPRTYLDEEGVLTTEI